MPQYRYAHDRNQNVIDVLDLPSDRDEISDQYICLGCGNLLIAKTKGEKREKHFAHKVRVICNEETYLHRLAKLTFCQIYQHCLENNEAYLIELSYPKVCGKFNHIIGHRCNLGTVRKTHDLTQYYDAVKLEKRDDTFIPDVLIYSSKDPNQKIYIEIAVTHFLSEEKQQSDNRIIEIPIEAESDIETIRTRELSEENASFVNFDRQSAPVTDAECTCALQKFFYFFIYSSGKCFMDDATIREIETKRRKVANKLLYVKIHPSPASAFFDRGDLFREFVIEAHKRGFSIKNCLLCRFSGQNWDQLSEETIFCKKERQTCNSNAATDCRHFWLKPDVEL